MSKEINFYVKAFDETKKKLENISSSFCAAKWLQVSLHLTNGHTHSCYHPPVHKINLEDLNNRPSSLHNTKIKFEERKMMLLGQRPKGCEYCWKIEDAGHISDRFYRSSEHWAEDKIDSIAKLSFDYDINPTYVEVNFNQTCNFKCSYCSPHLSNTWQEEIEKFGPYKINDYFHNDIETLKTLNLMPLDSSRKENPYVQAFWKWWPELYKDLKVFRMTGGEPLLDANTYKILDYVVNNPNKNLELSVTSNMCPPKEIFEKFLNKVKLLDNVQHTVECYVPDPHNGSSWESWQHYIIGANQKQYHKSTLPSIERSDIKQTFPKIGHALEDGSYTYLYNYNDYACKHFSLYVSLDAVNEQAEYIRYGLNYKQLVSNVEKFLDSTHNTSITFINTFNLLSISTFKEFLELILKLRKKHNKQSQKKKYNKAFQRIWFDIPVLRNPEWMSILNCNDELLEELESIELWMRNNNTQDYYDSTLEGFKNYEIEKVARNINLIKENQYKDTKLSENLNNLMIFFAEHDRRRSTSLQNTFPEIYKWIKSS